MTGVAVIVVLLVTYAGRIGVGDANPFDYFGYFTNQTSLWAALIVIVSGIRAIQGRPRTRWLTAARAVAGACLIIVAVVYNVLVPGTGTAPVWVSVLLHGVFPVLVLLDLLLAPDRRPLPWRWLWMVLPYPLLWMAVVLTRGVTDGWVPYGFLLPERGVASLLAHVVGLILALLVAGVLTWAATRAPVRGVGRGGSARSAV